MKFEELKSEVEKLFPNAERKNLGDYAILKYPKHLGMMKMKVNRYDVSGFGSIMVMNTSMMGMMKLNTLSFTPSEGKNVPFLLIDTMSMGKKRIAYVEFYNTTEKSFPELSRLKEKYRSVKDYGEKDAWYVKERMEGSLIKCGTKKEEGALMDMVVDALTLYRDESESADKDPNNIVRLSAFSERMIHEGNPSSATLEKVLGKEKAVDFFRQVVMPLK